MSIARGRLIPALDALNIYAYEKVFLILTLSAGNAGTSADGNYVRASS